MIWFLFILLISFSSLQGQSIDSSNVKYNTASKELECYVGGELPWLDQNFIVDINYHYSMDTVFIDLHFLPCQKWNTFMAYDTAFNKLFPLNPGNLMVKFTTIFNPYLDSNSCRFNPDSIEIAHSIHNLAILHVAEQSQPQINIFPNPVQAFLQVHIPEQEKITSLKITDVFGRTVSAITKENGQIDCSHLPNGLYSLSLTTSKGTQVLRFSKVD